MADAFVLRHITQQRERLMAFFQVDDPRLLPLKLYWESTPHVPAVRTRFPNSTYGISVCYYNQLETALLQFTDHGFDVAFCKEWGYAEFKKHPNHNAVVLEILRLYHILSGTV